LWRRGWDSDHCWLLKTKNLTELGFRTIREIRTKALIETRIEHVRTTGVWGLAAPGCNEISEWLIAPGSIRYS
jgi:hypothetical protein